jgi:Ca2+-binding EF-hand superfamily protein
MAHAAQTGASIMNIGASQPPARVTRYTAVRTKQESRMGAGSLISGMGSVTELKKQIHRKGTGLMSSDFSSAARAHREQEAPLSGMDRELQQIERDIVLQQSQLRLEQARSAALEKQAILRDELQKAKMQNALRSKELGTNIPTSSTNGKGIPATLPRSIRYEKLALCFRVWFKHPWYEGEVEGFDVRNFLLRYYMSDQTLEIIEDDKKAFLKRTQLKKADGSNFEPPDFAVGNVFHLSGRTFTVCDADDATRKYFSDEYPNVQMAQALAVPIAPLRTSFAPGMERAQASGPPDWQSQVRAQRQNPGKFLDDDGKILTFVGMWDDTARPLGELRRLKIRFYVADHTMEVGEMLNGNSGRDLTSRFRILRQRLKKPKNLSSSISTGVNFGATGGRTNYFEPKDLVVGSIVHIYGRPVLVTSCDHFTRQYYSKVCNLDMPDNMIIDWNPNEIKPSGTKKQAVSQGFQFLEPQDRVMQLEKAIREKLEVASNFGTNVDQKRHLQAMFHVFDSDGSGYINQVEFKEAMQSFSMFGNDVDTLFKKYDSDNSNSLSISEFASMLYNNPAAMKFSMDTGRSSRGALQPAKKIDDTTNTIISTTVGSPNGNDNQMLLLLEQNLRDKAELLSNFSSSDAIKQRKLAEMFKRYDTNGNGTLSRIEFRAALMSMHFPIQDADIMFDSYDGKIFILDFSHL